MDASVCNVCNKCVCMNVNLYVCNLWCVYTYACMYVVIYVSYAFCQQHILCNFWIYHDEHDIIMFVCMYITNFLFFSMKKTNSKTKNNPKNITRLQNRRFYLKLSRMHAHKIFRSSLCAHALLGAKRRLKVTLSVRMYVRYYIQLALSGCQSLLVRYSHKEL